MGKNNSTSTVKEPAETPCKKQKTAALVALTAKADCQAANIVDPEERRALWMKYLRSRQSGNEKKSFEMGNVKNMPESMRAQVRSDAQKYFELWKANKGDWAKVQLSVTKSQSKALHRKRQRKWMRGDQIDEAFPPSVAAAFKEELFGHPEWYREHPQLPGNLEAAEYKILVNDAESEDEEDKENVDLQFHGDLSTTTGPEELNTAAAHFVAQNAEEPGGGKPPVPIPQLKTPEEIAAEEARKKQELEEEEEKLLLAKDAPTRINIVDSIEEEELAKEVLDLFGQVWVPSTPPQVLSDVSDEQLALSPAELQQMAQAADVVPEIHRNMDYPDDVAEDDDAEILSSEDDEAGVGEDPHDDDEVLEEKNHEMYINDVIDGG